MNTSAREARAELDKLLDHLSHPAVRDLAWVIGAPHLATQALQWLTSIEGGDIGGELSDLTRASVESSRGALEAVMSDLASSPLSTALEEMSALLSALDQDPTPLLESLAHQRAQHTRVRLGVYVEHLAHYWLAELVKCDPLLREIQIYEPQERGVKTLGALDFVGSVPSVTSPEWVHLELASKFYLEHETLSEDPLLTQLRGPNERDSLHKKLSRLIEHQLPLSAHPRAQARLAELGAPEVERRVMWLKGRLFLWAGRANIASSTSIPLRGLWVRRSQLSLLTPIFGETFVALERPKPHWLAPPHLRELTLAPQMTPEALAEALTQVRGERGASMWFCAACGDHQELKSSGRWVMVVPDDWGRRALT